MRLGIDSLLLQLRSSEEIQKAFRGRRIGLVGNPASVTSLTVHSLDALYEYGRSTQASTLKLSAAFGPQHGMRGDKQDNMIESDDYTDPATKIPVYSLYGKVRRPTPEMLGQFDLLLVDLQDIGCRIYTYFTTLFYLMEDCSKAGKELWILDRPNPAGRPIEGSKLIPGWESFVGAAPVPMRHGLTLGELGLWIKKTYKFDLPFKVISMEAYKTSEAPGYGWPTYELPWINPSPNVPTLSMTRVFCGTVMLEGTNLSEGRGTTRPLEIFGAPGLNASAVINEMRKFEPRWLEGCVVRECFFEPTFHKFKGELCSGIQIHVDQQSYRHDIFKPYRFMLSFFKALKKVQPEIFSWRQPPYEYEKTRLPIDLLNGGPGARQWVDDAASTSADLEALLRPDESSWSNERKDCLLY